jgi:hypothetical protein
MLSFPYFNNYLTVHLYALALALQLAVLCVMRWPLIRAWRPEKLWPGEKLAGILVLITLPFIGAFGTSNSLWLNTLFDAVPWIGLILLCALAMELHVRPQIVALVPVVLIAGFTTAEIAYGIIWRPYLLAEPLHKQTVPVQYPETVAGLKVDSATSQAFNELHRVLHSNGFREGDPIIGLYNVPGYVYMVGGVSPGSPTFFTGRNARSCVALARSRADLDRAFVLITRQLDAGLDTCMQRAGLDFPNAYRELDRVYNPYSAGPYGWHTLDEWIRILKKQ